MKQTTVEDYLQKMVRLQDFVSQHLDDELDPNSLSRVSGMSKHHMHRVFKAMFGESLMNHVRRLRLERAAIELRWSEERILDVAVRAGYSSHEAFTRAFKTRFEVSPMDWREEAIRPTPTEPTIDVVIRRYPEIDTYALRHFGPFSQVGTAFEKLIAQAVANGLEPPYELYGVYPDDPEITPESQLRSDVCLVADFSIDRELRKLVIPSGVFAVATHVGSYDSLHETYVELIGKWLPTSGYSASPEPLVEHYVDDPAVTPIASLRTEIRMRLE